MSQMERIPPHSDEAEKSVLGAALIDTETFYGISEILKPDDFYSESHKEIFRSMMDLYQRSEPIDVVTVSESLKRRNNLEAVGGRAYIAFLSTVVPTTANAVQYARIVSEKAMLRRLITAAASIVEKSYEEKLDADKVVDFAEATIFDVAKTKQTTEYSDLKDVLSTNLETIKEARERGGVLPGIPTHFQDLDKRMNGLHKSDLIIIAARPSMGKTAFALNIAQNVAMKEDKRVVIFSLEMPKEALGNRLISMDSRVDSRKLEIGDLSDEELSDVLESIDRMSGKDVIIDATPGIGVMEMRNKCRRIDAQRKIDLIVVDYLQIMSADVPGESRQQEVSNISRYLKQLAREMECPVIVLSQLSRASEKRQGSHRPMLSDLRDSGAIEQDADVVMFLHREDYYRTADEEPDNICEVILAKQRNGETGTVRLTWIPRFTKFVDRYVEGSTPLD
ncbi:MAG: replicative DNA helicase [Firmicutes bacterium]|jgi:replicative DNA helicase|nr:replicative DNA helicase [Bacillota bacterium]MBR0210423.1 replicative DNA helicase [Bacillota bacterium]MBR0517509.1 replicative DNA helicase [Bacillota bacterium]